MHRILFIRATDFGINRHGDATERVQLGIDFEVYAVGFKFNRYCPQAACHRIGQFTAGMKTVVLNTDILAVSKDALPLSTEIRVLVPRGAMNYR